MAKTYLALKIRLFQAESFKKNKLESNKNVTACRSVSDCEEVAGKPAFENKLMRNHWLKLQ
jgi:hypothetical protein